MKIGGGGGRNPYLSNANRTAKGGKTDKAKGAKKSGAASSAAEVSEVSSAESLAPVDELTSPIYDELFAASKKLDEDDLEDATQAVVVAILREKLGQQIPEREMESITKAITTSITGDDSLRTRLEQVLRRVAKKKKK